MEAFFVLTSPYPGNEVFLRMTNGSETDLFGGLQDLGRGILAAMVPNVNQSH